LAVFSIDSIDILHHFAATFHGLQDLSAAVDSGHTVGQAMPMTRLTQAFDQLIDDKLGGLSGSNEVRRYYLDE
jgi:hypothetical protein